MTTTGGAADPYLDPAKGVLRNLVGATTRADLSRAEGDLTFARGMELLDKPPAASGDLGELQAIHRQLFQDVYDWAGELRTIDMRKNTPDAEFFLPVQMIPRAAAFAAEELRDDGMLVGMDREKFVDRLAYHYDAFNYIHPFREGNGRTQRLLWNRVARDAGWGLDWRSVHGQTNDNASRIAIEKRDLGPLKQMFDQVVTAGTPARAHDAAWRAVELARASFPRSAVEDVHRRGSLGERPRTRPTSPDLGRGTEGMGR